MCERCGKVSILNTRTRGRDTDRPRSPSVTAVLWLGIVAYIRVRGRISARTPIARRLSPDARRSLAIKTITPERSRTLPERLRRHWRETAWPAPPRHVLPGLRATSSATTDRPCPRHHLRIEPCRCRRVLRWPLPMVCSMDTWAIRPCLLTCGTICTVAAPPLHLQQASPTSGQHPTLSATARHCRPRHSNPASRTVMGPEALLEALT